jgi:hypothetical protein
MISRGRENKPSSYVILRQFGQKSLILSARMARVEFEREKKKKKRKPHLPEAVAGSGSAANHGEKDLGFGLSEESHKPHL